MRSLALASLFLSLFALALARPQTAPPARWWKGNTHTHTLWSDGDGALELVADWYREHGYEFLVLSDHDVLSTGERWVPVAPDGKLTEERVAALIERFGSEHVELRETNGRREMRLATLPELRARFEEPGRFLFMQGEEISDSIDGKPVHVNGVNLGEVIPPQGGATVREALERNVDAVIAQGQRLRRSTLAHVNHPNFEWAVTWQDLAHVAGDRFFEVCTSTAVSHVEGDPEHPSTEEMWDRATTLRLTELGLGALYGLATDDTHHYHAIAPELCNAGRGWVMVRSAALEPDALVEAMKSGEFYSTSGVLLRDVRCDGRTYTLEIEADPGVEYATRFVGTRTRGGAPFDVGATLAEVTGPRPEYTFHGDELFVRAVVRSSRPHPRPYLAGDVERAWTQPVLPASK